MYSAPQYFRLVAPVKATSVQSSSPGSGVWSAARLWCCLNCEGIFLVHYHICAETRGVCFSEQVPVEVKTELIERLVGAGLKLIEATSFVSPKWVPQVYSSPLASSIAAARVSY
jgi:hypothetical protein